MYSLKKRSKRILYVIILLVALLSVYTFYAHAENNTTVASREVGGMTLSATGARYQPYSFVSDWFTPQPGVAWPSGGACRYVLNGLIVSGNQEFYRTYGPENTFYVTGTINYSQCGNSLMNIKLTVTNTPGTTSWQTLSASTGVTSGA